MDAEMERVFGPAVGAGEMTAGEAVTPVRREDRPSEGDSDSAGNPENGSDTVPMASLARMVRDAFRINADHRKKEDAAGRSVDSRLRDCILAQTCSFTSEQVRTMVESGVSPKVFSPLTATKIRAAKSMFSAIVNYSDDKLFSIMPTPVPEMPPEAVQEAVMSVSAQIDGLFKSVPQSAQGLGPSEMAALQIAVARVSEAAVDAVSARLDAEANVRAKRLERVVADVMREGGFEDAFRDFINNICTYGTGVVAFSVRNVPKNVSEYDRKKGVRVIRRSVKSIPVYESISPVDCYPAPDAVDVGDGALCIRMRYTADELHRCVSSAKRNDVSSFGAEGWRENAVAELLEAHPNGGVRIEDETRDEAIRAAQRNGSDDTFDCTYEGIRCYVSVKGSMLTEIGVTNTILGKKVKDDEFYRVEAVVIGRWVVYCRIYDDRMGVPLAKGVFYELPGSWWGESIADKLVCCQTVVNNAIKALLQNMSMASGPMLWMNDLARFQDRSGTGLKAFGGKIWTFSNGGYSFPGQTSSPSVPMGVLSVPSNANELLSVFGAMVKQADLDSGIASWSEGAGGAGSGALRTAEGLKTFMESQNRGIQDCLYNNDRLVVRPLVRMTADWILLYGSDTSLRGDVEVVPVGLMGRVLKAQSEQSRLQMFSMVVNSQLLQQIAGIKGIVELWRPSLRDLDINPDNVCPTQERVEFLEAIQRMKAISDASSNQPGQDAQDGGAGAPPGVSQPPAPQQQQGGVSERRAVA